MEGPVVHETDVVKICGVGRVLDAYSKVFKKEVKVKGYTPNVLVNSKGWVKFEVFRKGNFNREVGHPFHFLFDGVLYMYKRNKLRMDDSFGLNHELLDESLHWDVSKILHREDGKTYVYIIGREEWLKRGVLYDISDEELQVFLEMPKERRLPLKELLSVRNANRWFNECRKVTEGELV